MLYDFFEQMQGKPISLEWESILEDWLSRKNHLHFLLMQLGYKHLDKDIYEDKSGTFKISVKDERWHFKYLAPSRGEGSLSHYLYWRNPSDNCSFQDYFKMPMQYLRSLEASDSLMLPAIETLQMEGYLEPHIFFHSTMPLNQQLLNQLGILSPAGELKVHKIVQEKWEFERTHNKIGTIRTSAKMYGELVEFAFEYKINTASRRIDLFQDIEWTRVKIYTPHFSGEKRIIDQPILKPERLYELSKAVGLRAY